MANTPHKVVISVEECHYHFGQEYADLKATKELWLLFLTLLINVEMRKLNIEIQFEIIFGLNLKATKYSNF